ncbi:MAG: hypothetical protein ACKVQC_03175 [Elusimicrobiota bacterium]
MRNFLLTNEKIFFNLTYIILSILFILPIWSVKYLPMSDLPQHVAQVFMFRNFNNPFYQFSDTYYLNWFTPYFIGIVLPGLLTYIFTALVSVKILLSLVIFFTPFFLKKLIIRTQGDPWWCFAGFVIPFGFSFYWGFLPYLAAIPFGIFLIEKAISLETERSLKNILIFLLLSILTFFSHAIIYATSLMIALSWLMTRSRWDIKGTFLRLFILGTSFPVAVLWKQITQKNEFRFNFSAESGGSFTNRWNSLLSYITGSSEDWLYHYFCLFLVSIIIIGVSYKRVDAKRFLLFIPISLLYFFLPNQLFGVYFIYQRLAFFFLIVFLMLFQCDLMSRRVFISRTLLIGALFFWSFYLFKTFLPLRSESKDFDMAAEKIPANQKVLGLIIDRTVGNSPFYLNHFPAYYQAEKGGVLGFSFAVYYNTLIRYKKNKEPVDFWTSHFIDWSAADVKHNTMESFDYLLIRLHSTPEKDYISQNFSFIVKSGDWWVYKKNGTI